MLRQNEIKRNELIEKIGKEADYEQLETMVRLVNSWNGCLEDLDVWENDEEFFECVFSTRDDLVRAIAYGDYRYMDQYVRLNAYGNVESLDGYERASELERNKEEIIDEWLELYEKEPKQFEDQELDNLIEIVDEVIDEIDNEL